MASSEIRGSFFLLASACLSGVRRCARNGTLKLLFEVEWKPVNLFGQNDRAGVEQFDLTMSLILAFASSRDLRQALDDFIFEATQENVRNEVSHRNTLVNS